MKLHKTIKYTVTITAKTGLHIGAGNTLMQIGGLDQPVMKTKAGEPYIPGSSLKGKLRSLYELHENKVSQGGQLHPYCKQTDCEICCFFGFAGLSAEEEKKQNSSPDKQVVMGPTRFIFRDLFLSDESRDAFREQKKHGVHPFEMKMEVSINRHTGAGQNPRPLERVPAGTIFTGTLLIRMFLFDTDEGQPKTRDEISLAKFGDRLSVFVELLGNDYLGGQGSRGSGQVSVSFKDDLDKKKEHAYVNASDNEKNDAE